MILSALFSVLLLEDNQVISNYLKKLYEVETVIIWASDKFTFSSMCEKQGELQELCMDKI